MFLPWHVTKQQFRTDWKPSSFSPKATNNLNAVIGGGPNYTMGYVEFDDQEWPFNRKQIDSVTSQFFEESKANGLLMVVLIMPGVRCSARMNGEYEKLIYVVTTFGWQQHILIS
jgi:hypothetical protein